MSTYDHTDTHTRFSNYGSPFFWYEKAKALKFSADLIKGKEEEIFKNFDALDHSDYTVVAEFTNKCPIDILSVANGLYAFCIECLLKGIIISMDGSHLSKGHLSKEMNSHQLIDLAQTAMVEISSDERTTLASLTHDIFSFRYPIPRKVTKTISRAYPNDFFGVINKLIERLSETLDSY